MVTSLSVHRYVVNLHILVDVLSLFPYTCTVLFLTFFITFVFPCLAAGILGARAYGVGKPGKTAGNSRIIRLCFS